MLQTPDKDVKMKDWLAPLLRTSGQLPGHSRRAGTGGEIITIHYYWSEGYNLQTAQETDQRCRLERWKAFADSQRIRIENRSSD